MNQSQDNPASIRELYSGDVRFAQEISRLFDAGLGEGYIAPEEVAEAMASERRFVFGAFTANGKELTGVRIASVLEADEIAEFEEQLRRLGVEKENCLDLSGGGRVGVGKLDAVVVKAEMRRRGIGSKLVEAALQKLENECACTTIVTESWESGRIDSSASVLEKYGFQFVARSPEHWKEESIRYGFGCAKCDAPPCTCSARFYVRRRENK